MKKSLFLLFSLSCFIFGSNAFAKSTVLSQWLELGPNNAWIVRAVTSSAACPDIMINKKKTPMEVRSTPNDHFSVTICQTILPPNTTSASIQGQRLHLPKANPHKIVVMGDTGCELEDGSPPQNCNDPRQWAFPVMAKRAAALKPDLVIHVGDYLYREASCPPGDAGCAKSPYGDDWAAWQADFFHPANPLLKRAPWIFTRGNHETCDRGGEGWTKLLDPFAFKHCFNHSPIYSVDVGDTRLFIMDSANASDVAAPPEQVSWYENYLQVVRKSSAKHNWLVTHKPFWFIFKANPLTQIIQDTVLNTLQTAWLNTKLSNVDLLLSGHLHRFQTVNFAHSRPPQVIVGDSGTRLDVNLGHHDLKGLKLANETISEGISIPEFGFMTMEKTGDSWRAQVRNPDGKIIAKCTFKNQQFLCIEHKIIY